MRTRLRIQRTVFLHVRHFELFNTERGRFARPRDIDRPRDHHPRRAPTRNAHHVQFTAPRAFFDPDIDHDFDLAIRQQHTFQRTRHRLPHTRAFDPRERAPMPDHFDRFLFQTFRQRVRDLDRRPFEFAFAGPNNFRAFRVRETPTPTTDIQTLAMRDRVTEIRDTNHDLPLRLFKFAATRRRSEFRAPRILIPTHPHSHPRARRRQQRRTSTRTHMPPRRTSKRRRNTHHHQHENANHNHNRDHTKTHPHGLDTETRLHGLPPSLRPVLWLAGMEPPARALRRYLLRAARSQPARLLSTLILLHTPKALESFWALVNTRRPRATARFAATFPGPENDADGGTPNTEGCGEGAARHASAVVHAGGTSDG